MLGLQMSGEVRILLPFFLSCHRKVLNVTELQTGARACQAQEALITFLTQTYFLIASRTCTGAGALL